MRQHTVQPQRTTSLDACDVSVRYGGVIAVDGVSLSTEGAAVIGLIGPNGAGKSSLANAICGTVRTNGGTVSLSGTDITHAPPHLRARLGLRRTFQNLELFGSFTVAETLHLAAIAGNGPWHRRAERRRVDQHVGWVCELLGLDEQTPLLVQDLPYGSKKLVELARAFVTKPRLVVLDEPVAGLDTKEKSMVSSQIRLAADEIGATVLLIEHDMTTVQSLCDRVYVLDMGQVIATGTFTEVIADERVREAYLGTSWSGLSHGPPNM